MNVLNTSTLTRRFAPPSPRGRGIVLRSFPLPLGGWREAPGEGRIYATVCLMNPYQRPVQRDEQNKNQAFDESQNATNL
jgi:hypothetical protein